MRSLALIILVVGVLLWANHAGEPRHPLLIQTSAPVIPWTLNTQCAVTTRNLPHRTERIA